MAYDSGYSRRSGSERELQPVAIVSVDPVARLAVGATRTRHTVRINCAYATGDTITTPAVGEQWYCERFDMEWRLYGRIPFNDPTLNIEPEAGQVSVGSGSGPLELNGTEIRSNGKVFRLNGVYYRDSGQALERSTDQVTWEAITVGGLVQIVAKALTDYQGATQAGAVTALEGWADIVQEVIDNFTLFWNLICGNVFVNGLKRLGVGSDDVERIVDGFQNFINYLFGILFCDFTGDLTPQTLLARLRDLLAPIINNPFVQGLQKIAEILGVAVGNLLNDAVAGLTSLIELIFNIITCNWTALADQLTAIFRIIDEADGDNPFGPANIIKSLFNLFQLLGSPEINGIPNPIGIFVTALRDFFTVLFESTGNLLEDALGGLVQFVSLIFGILTCDADALTKAQQVIDAITGDGSIFDNIVKTLFGVLTPLTQTEIAGIPNPVGIFLAGLKDFYEAVSGNTATNLADGAIGGAVEFVRLIFRVISCSDTNVLADLTSLVDSFTSGYDDPFGILKFLGDLFTSILSNPLVVAIQDFLVGFFPDLAGTSLIQQLLDGASNLVHLLIKVVTSILPFRDLWETLIPFVDWAKVDEMEAVLPDLTGFFLNGLEDLWKMIFKPIDLIIQGIIPAAGDTAFTDFIENLINFFSGNGLLSSFFGDPGAFNLQTLANEFMQNVLGLLTLDENGLLKIVTDFVPTVVGDFLANLMALFGVDFNVNAEDFDLATALPAVATAIAQGIFGQAAATVRTIFDRLVGLFGGSSVFTGGTFDLAAIATYFTNNVLNLATSALQSLVEGAGSLVYQIAQAIITGIRGIPFVGAGIANFLQGVVDTLVNFSRGTVKSGSNILADPGAEIASMWTDPTTGLPVQADATRVTTAALKRSAGASLRVTSGGSTAKKFWFNVDNTGAVASIDTDTGEVNYAECYVLYPSTVSGTNNAGTSGTVTLVARYYDSTGAVTTTPELTATASMSRSNTTWVKLSGNFTTPTTGVANTQYDRVDFGFRLVGGQTTPGANFYVDDMLVREITAAQSAADDTAATNLNLYGSTGRPASNAEIRSAAVPTLTGVTGRTKVPELQTTIDSINQGFLGGSGTGNAASTVLTRLQGLNQNLWGLNTLGTTIKDAANPAVDNLLQGWRATANTGWSSTNIRETGAEVASAVAGLGAAINSLKSTSGGATFSGIAKSVSFSDTSYGSLSGAGLDVANIAGYSASLSLINGTAAWSGPVYVDQTIRARHVTATNTDFQKVGVVSASTGTGTSSSVYIYARMNSSETAYVYAKITGQRVTIGYNNGNGVETPLNTKVYGGYIANIFWPGAVYWLECGTSNGATYTYRFLIGDSVELIASDPGYAVTGASNRFTGFGGNAPNNSNIPGAVAAFAFYDNTPATYTGSSFRAYRSSTTSVSVGSKLSSTGASNVGHYTFPPNYYVEDYKTSDLSYDATNNRLTVTVEGWYQVKIEQYGSVTMGLGAGGRYGPVVFKNAITYNPDGTYYTPNPAYYASSAPEASGRVITNNINVGWQGFGDTMLVYCKKNDTLTPGYYTDGYLAPSGTASGSIMNGESTGKKTYWSVQFLNNVKPSNPTTA